MRLKGKFLVDSKMGLKKPLSFKKVEDILEVTDIDCIIITSLHPDFSMVLPRVRLIISEKGSTLSHLAILAREYGRSIILVEEIDKMPENGALQIKRRGEETVEINV